MINFIRVQKNIVRLSYPKEIYSAYLRCRKGKKNIHNTLKFIYDSYSCRVDKGIHNAQKRALHFSRATKYYFQLDIKRVVKNFKYKKAKYLQSYENQKGKMSLEEIKKFLSVQASFVGHISDVP